MKPDNPITHAIYSNRGGIEIVHEGDQDDNFIVETVRGGILWPAVESPGYFCILGQRPTFNDFKKKPLVLLAEHSTDLPQKLIETITIETRRMMCRDIFCDFNEHTFQFQEDLYRHIKKFGIVGVNLNGPYLADWINGILSAQQWMSEDALELPRGTVLRDQLSGMKFEDRDPTRRGPFYAVDALRCVLGSFEVPAPRPVTIKQAGYFYA